MEEQRSIRKTTLDGLPMIMLMNGMIDIMEKDIIDIRKYWHCSENTEESAGEIRN